MRVPYFRPTWGRPEEAAVLRALRSGWITMGEEVLRFEAEVARMVGARHAVAVNSCTAGLHLALVAAGVKPGEPVVVPVFTFTASAGSILQALARPVFVDVDPETLNIDCDQARQKVEAGSRTIMPVDIAGLPADYGRLGAIQRSLGCRIVVDAAHSLGARYGKLPVGQFGDFTCFSFYANKNLTTAEGGMVTTKSARAADDLRKLRLHGMSRDAWKRYQRGGRWYYEIDRHGFKCNMSDIQAAFGRAQLARFADMQARRERAASWYDEALANMGEIIRPPRRAGSTHAWHLYIVRLAGRHAARRDRVIEFLGRHEVETSVHFIPLCLQPYWRRKFRLSAKSFPHAVEAYRGAISLPMHPGLSRAECRYVIETLKTALVKTR
jgi:dTDP-4-amino-4,6-dideoxygalactose transaminase